MKDREIIKRALEPKMPDKEKIRLSCIENNGAKINIGRVVLLTACLIILCASLAAFPLFSEKQGGKSGTKGGISVNTDPVETSVGNDDEYDESDGLPAIGGGGPICQVHAGHYHYFDCEVFFDYVGVEEFCEWEATFRDENGWLITNDNSCLGDLNIMNFINTFDIPDEVIIEAYFSKYYNNYWNIELLLSRDEATYEEYAVKLYDSGNELYNRGTYKQLLSYEEGVKERIRYKIGEKTDEKSKEYYKTINLTPLSTISIMEMVENSSLTVEDLDSCVSVDPNLSDIEYNNYYCRPYKYVYNFDLLFDERVALDAEIKKLEFDPLVPEAVQLDALLHVGDNGELALKGEAVETDHGIYIPEGLLPQNDEDLEKVNDFVIHKGRIYWYKETVSSDEYTISEDVVDPYNRACTWNDYSSDDYYGESLDWDKHLVYNYTSTLDCDVYQFYDYDESFRLMLMDYDKDPDSFMVFENNKGIILKKGDDIFGERALNLKENAKKLYIDGEESEKLLKNINKILCGSEFVLDTDFEPSVNNIKLEFDMRDGSRVELTLYENGYLEYSEIIGYGVYLRIEDRELIKSIMN